jgi:hypothetical protein
VKTLPVPTNGWNNGAWNKKATQFYLLAEMLGLKKPSISPDELQELFRAVGSAKVFSDNVQAFLRASGRDIKWVCQRLEQIEAKLGLMDPLPFMSLKGVSNPKDFAGVAIWPAGITNWSELRLDQIELAQKAGAYFEHIIVLGSTRKAGAPADRRHWYINPIPAGHEPTERGIQSAWIEQKPSKIRFIEAELPELNADGKPLSLQQQLEHFVETGQYERYVAGKKIYVPSTPNSLYVPLHVRRLLGHEDVWFSQGGARLTRDMPDYWWPTLQDVLTTPNGIIRLWVELLHAGCMK